MAQATIDNCEVFPSSLTEVTIKNPEFNFKILIPVNELFRVNAIFEKHEYAVSKRFLPSSPLTIVDVGANIGLFSLYWKLVRPDSTFYCFEPAPNTFNLLKKNINRLPGINLYPFGLGLRDERSRMAVHPLNTGQNSIKIFDQNVSFFEVQIIQALKAMEAMGLHYIDILKIDTEGCEVDILKSLQTKLTYVGIIMLEYHSERDRRQIDRILTGFTLFGSNSSHIGLGTVKYINSRLLQ